MVLARETTKTSYLEMIHRIIYIHMNA